MLFELLKKNEIVEIVDKNTKEKKEITITRFFLHNESLEKDIPISEYRKTYKDGRSYSNKDVLSLLAVLVK